MLSYVIRRSLLIFPTLLGITILVFSIMALAPGGVGASLLGAAGDMRPEERAAMEAYINARYGLDQPLPVQYLRWLNRVSPIGMRTDENMQPDGFGFKVPELGMSFAKNRPVTELIAQALPITLLLNALSLPIVFILSIVMGVYAQGRRPGCLAVALSRTGAGRRYKHRELRALVDPRHMDGGDADRIAREPGLLEALSNLGP